MSSLFAKAKKRPQEALRVFHRLCLCSGMVLDHALGAGGNFEVSAGATQASWRALRTSAGGGAS